MRRSGRRARLRRASSSERLQRLRERSPLPCDVCEALPDLAYLFGRRALRKLRVGELRVQSRRLLLQLIALALQARPLLREIDETFERHGHFCAARKHCASRGTRRVQSLPDSNVGSARKTRNLIRVRTEHFAQFLVTCAD